MLDVRKLTRYQGKPLRTGYVAHLGDYQGPPASTPAAAKRACLEDVAEVLKGSYEPRFLRFGDYTVVILRKPYRPPAWEYTILGPDTPRTESGHLRPCLAGWYPSADEAERAARRHLAQFLIRPQEGYTAEEVVDPRDREDHLRYYRWHVAHYAAQARGLTDEACREAGFLHRSGYPLEEAVQLAAAAYTVLTAPPRVGGEPVRQVRRPTPVRPRRGSAGQDGHPRHHSSPGKGVSSVWKVGTIQGFRGSWGSGLAELVIDGYAIPCDNAPTVRALEALFGGVIGPGHTVHLKALVGQRVAYRTGNVGLLEGLPPADAVESLSRQETARQRRHRRLA